jgi:hypothetical protein
MRSSVPSPWLLFGVGLLLLPAVAEAYIDPGAGSYLLQILAASIFGALFAIKLFWQRIKSLLGRLTGSRPRKGDEDPSS